MRCALCAADVVEVSLLHEHLVLVPPLMRILLLTVLSPDDSPVCAAVVSCQYEQLLLVLLA